MKLLVLSVVTPYPIDTGGNAGTFKLLNKAKEKYDITFLSLPASAAKVHGLKAAWPEIRVLTQVEKQKRTTKKDQLKSFIKRVLGIKVPKPSRLTIDRANLIDCYFEDFLQQVQELTRKETFDLIQVEFMEFAPIVPFLPKDTKKIFVHHELWYRRLYYEYGLMKDKSLSYLWKIEAFKTLEINLLKKFDRVCTVSPEDKVYLEEAGLEPSKVLYSPLPIEIRDRKINIPFKPSNKLVYLGPEDHYPNVDAVKWFLENCWQDILSEHPALEFHVVGRWKEETIAEMPNLGNVHWRGFVEDLAGVFEGAALVVPLRIGGGMRMKILEAFSWNVPIITSSIGAEGLPMKHEENCWIADSPEEMLGAVNKYMQGNSETIHAMASNGRSLVESSFSIEKCSGIREGLYKMLLSSI